MGSRLAEVLIWCKFWLTDQKSQWSSGQIIKSFWVTAVHMSKIDFHRWYDNHYPTLLRCGRDGSHLRFNFISLKFFTHTFIYVHTFTHPSDHLPTYPSLTHTYARARIVWVHVTFLFNILFPLLYISIYIYIFNTLHSSD